MNSSKTYKRFWLSLFFIVIIGSGCEYDGPKEIWNPEVPDYSVPTINRIEPENSIAALEIKIIGDNFSPLVENNSVYIAGNKAQIKSASKTEICIYRPNLAGDSLTFKVVVKGAYTIAEYSPYKLELMTSTVEAFNQSDNIALIAIDANNNIYGASNRVVFKVTPEGDETEYGSYSGRVAYMRSGPGGYLYIQKSNNNALSRIAPGGGNLLLFYTLPKRVSFFDFDSYSNIFLGGKNSGLVLLKPDSTASALGIFDEYDIKALRVFDGYVYVVAEYTGSEASIPATAIWKNQILNPNGDLGDTELVYDWANSGDFAGAGIFDITFSQDGDLYIGTDHIDPVLIVHPDGRSEPLYKDILLSPITNLVWDNSHYLYIKRDAPYEAVQVIRVEMNKPGAPYYGRGQ